MRREKGGMNDGACVHDGKSRCTPTSRAGICTQAQAKKALYQERTELRAARRAAAPKPGIDYIGL